MIAVVHATRFGLLPSLVAAASWRQVTGSPVVVLVDHPDLVAPFARAHGTAVEIVSWAQTDTSPEAPGATLAAVVARQEPGTPCIVLPAGALVLGPPTALARGAEEAGVAIATRAASADVPADGRRPSAEDIAAPGRRHLGLLGLRAGHAGVAALAAWWDATPAALRGALIETRAGTFAAVDEPGVGVAWWNLHERPLAREGGVLTAAGRPVAVADLTDWSPQHPHMLHPDMTRLLGSGDPALRGLVDDYAARYAAAAEGTTDPAPATWPGDPALEDLLARIPGDERLAALRDDPGARERLLAWAGECDAEDTVWGLNRYLIALRRTRFDLQMAFPDINDRTDARGYLAWARADGVAAEGVPARYVGPVPTLEDPAGTGRPDGGPEPDSDADAEPGERVDEAGPGAAVTEAGTAPQDPYDGLHGVNLVGLFGEPALGIAEIARQVLAGLRASGVPVQPVSVDRRGRPDPAEGDDPLPHRVTIACVNADLLPLVRHRLRTRVRDDSHHVGLWWWELTEVPASWDRAMELVDEVWAGTSFVADAFSSRFDGPVRAVPLGLGELAPAGALPAPVAADPRPYVLTTFDYASRIERKNPVGAIEAFRRSDLGDGVRLVVKSVNAPVWPREAELVRLAAVDAGEDRVLLLDGAVDEGAQAALVAGAVAHLALHRSEGLGLTIAESMLRGVPVVATDYGGSTDLLDAATGWPVPYTEARVPAGCAPYPAGAPWAEPDLAAAADALREVVEGGAAVEERVRAGRAAAEARAARIAAGDDLGDAARAAIAVLRAVIDEEARAVAEATAAHEEKLRAQAAARRTLRARARRVLDEFRPAG